MIHLSRIAVFFIAGLAVGFLSSCEYSTTRISESLSSQTENSLRQKLEVENPEKDFELIDLLGDSAAVFSVNIATDVPEVVFRRLTMNLDERIREMGLFGNILSDNQLAALFEQNRRLNQARDVYLDSLSVVSASNKDISNPLGKYLKTDNFLVFQIDRWPCEDCTVSSGIRMKLRVVDTETGYIVWTGINEKDNVLDEEWGKLETVALDLSNELLENFLDRFKRKWHKKRHENLAMMAK